MKFLGKLLRHLLSLTMLLSSVLLVIGSGGLLSGSLFGIRTPVLTTGLPRELVTLVSRETQGKPTCAICEVIGG